MEFKAKPLRILNDTEKRYADELGISERFMSLLLNRGIALNEIKDFIHPQLGSLSSPFEIKDMNIASRRLLKAIEKKERILIFGDYDCDGICATSILMLYLKDKTDCQYFIPSRNDGYGLSVTAVDNILSKRKFDLLISVDCGITSYDVVEHLKSKGIDVIITDHHEPQSTIPDCIVVDPKIEKKGFYDLCGAGVALKLVEACSSRKEAEKYIDICAIATIADVVPLVKDNRIIVSYGLKRIEKDPRLGIKMLLGQDAANTHNVMYKLAPRMNSAGRLSSAMKVVNLFTETDYFMLHTLSDELLKENQLRQELCESVASEALKSLKGIDLNKTRVIVLYNENWEAGVIGIAASRIAEEFKCPAILFTKGSEGEIKGSARSVPAVNIFEMLSRFSGLYTTFGGHSQAAGVGMKMENFDKFKELINQAVVDTTNYEDFLPKVNCEMELPFNMNFLDFTKELKLLEPTGYGNPRPNFLIKAEGLKFDRMGNKPHVKFRNNRIELVGFYNFADSLFAKTGKVELEVTLDINVYQNQESAQGLIQSLNIKSLDLSESDSDCLNLHHFDCMGKADLDAVTEDEVSEMINKPFGTLFVCFSKSDYEKLVSSYPYLSKLPISVGRNKFMIPENSVIICPSVSFDYYQYTNVIVCGDAFTEGYYRVIKEQCGNVKSIGYLSRKPIALGDDLLRDIYKACCDVQNKDRVIKIGGQKELYNKVSSRIKVDEAVFYLGLKILTELNLVSISEKGVLNTQNIRSNLQSSYVYRNLNRID
ncbi:MAG: single-stranded-DNA-specific exonuclease RecJ [Clostridia bacterium]|nr:single-stranded-DNA-specific exonuclease RecJ [Clostridia bacterium]